MTLTATPGITLFFIKALARLYPCIFSFPSRSVLEDVRFFPDPVPINFTTDLSHESLIFWLQLHISMELSPSPNACVHTQAH